MQLDRRQLLELADNELLRQCKVDRFRASGPGGQKRNKTESAVRLRHEASGLSAIAVESRSQHDNRQSALRRLRALIALDLREAVDLAAYQVPRSLAELIAGGNRKRGPRERLAVDYLAGMAALLDLFVAGDCSVSATAERLGLSTGGLAKLLLGDERVARKVNELRGARGMRALR